MPDPLTVTAAISLAGKAFSGVKKMIQTGREVEDCFGQISAWFECVHDVNKAKERAKNPTFFQKMTDGASIEKQALDSVIAQKQLQEQRTQLRSLIMMRYGKETWEDLRSTENKIRAERTRMIHQKIEFRRKLIDFIVVSVGSLVSLGIIFFIVWLAFQGR